MKLILTFSAFVLGVIAALQPFQFERSGEGDGDINVYITIGLINIIPANFNDNSRTSIEEDE